MSQWPPEYIYLASCLVAAIGGIGRLMGSDHPLTFRNFATAILLHGSVGGGFAAFGHAYFGWKDKPLATLGTAALYGAGIISPAIIIRVIEGALGLIKHGGGGDGAKDKN